MYAKFVDGVTSIKDFVYMVFVIGPFVFALFLLCKFILVQSVKHVLSIFLNMIMWMIESLAYVLGIDRSTPSPFFYGIMLRCLKVSSHDIGSSISTPIRVDRFAMLSNLFAQNALAPRYANRIFLVCAPKSKEENLEKALMQFLYDRLRAEAISQTLINPTGNFDLLAECPNLAKVSGLERFPANFKSIRDTAIEEILRSTPNVNALSVNQYNLLVELIKMIMIKKAYENIRIFNNSIGSVQVGNIISEMCSKDFMPSCKDMIGFISASFNIGVEIMTPSNKVANLYNTLNATFIRVPIGMTPPISTMRLLEQESGSYTLVV